MSSRGAPPPINPTPRPKHLVSLTTPNISPLPPHLPLFPLWPASLVCLGWLIIRDTKILLYPPSFFSLHWNESLPWQRSGLWTTARRYPAIYCPFPPHKRGVWEGIFSHTHRHTHTECNPHKQKLDNTKKRQQSKHTHFLAWFAASDRTQNKFSSDWCLLSSPGAVSLPASLGGLRFPWRPTGSPADLCPLPDFFFGSWPHTW